MRPRISLTFISLTCLVGTMMLVTISRYGQDAELTPIGIRSPVHRFVISSPDKSSSSAFDYHVDHLKQDQSVAKLIENSSKIDDVSNDLNVIASFTSSKSSPFRKSISIPKKWLLASSKLPLKTIVGGNSVFLDVNVSSDQQSSKDAIVKNPISPFSVFRGTVTSSPSTAIASLSSTSPSSPIANTFESTKKPVIMDPSTGSKESEVSEPLSPSVSSSSNNPLHPPLNSENQSNHFNLAQSTRIPRPKITFGLEDLDTTSNFVINKLQFCDEDNGATIDLLVVVTSAVTHFEARDAIRKTWGGFAVERGARLMFLLGSPNPGPTENLVQSKVNEEEEKFGDILQGSFVDNYYNLTLKSISLLQFVNDTCDQVKFVLKIDDDMFVNMQMMVDFSETRTFSKVIIGKLARKWRPHHDPKSKWFVPSSAFNGTIFPNFATGPAYMLTGDSAKSLLETALTLTPIYLEDVYVTGIVAEKAGIRRLNHALMKNTRLKVDACTFKRFITSHQHSPQEILSLWKLVYEPPTRNCTLPKSTLTPTSVKLTPVKTIKNT